MNHRREKYLTDRVNQIESVERETRKKATHGRMAKRYGIRIEPTLGVRACSKEMCHPSRERKELGTIKNGKTPQQASH